MPERGDVYLLASHPDGTSHTGVTSDLVRRVWEHSRITWRGAPTVQLIEENIPNGPTRTI